MISFLYAVLCIVSICIGFFFGYKIGKNEKIETPVKKVSEIIENKRMEALEKEVEETINKEMEKMNTICDNINNFPNNQKEVK